MTYETTSGGATYGSRTITAFFDDRGEAERAVEKLVAVGIPRDQVRMVAGDGASSTRTGKESGGFWEALGDFFMPDEDRHTYAEGLSRGGYLISVNADEDFYDLALDILDDEGTVDIGEREASWRSEGWSGYSGAARPLTEISGAPSRIKAGRSTAVSDMDGEEEVIPVVEEELRVGKRDVSHGRVRIRSYVSETPVSEQVNLREENVTVQRRSVDRPLADADRHFEDRTIEVEERGEEAVVSKEARVREEIVLNKQVGQRTETVSDTVRKTEVEVEDDRLKSRTDKVLRDETDRSKR